MHQDLVLNIIPFEAPIQEGNFSFYTRKQEGYCPIHKDDLEGAFDGLINDSNLDRGNWLYTDFGEPRENAIIIPVDLKEKVYFAQHYYRHLIRQHFMGVADVMRSNFTNEIEVWFHNRQKSTRTYNTYNQFTLKVQHCRVTDGPELVVSFDGTSKVLTRSVGELYNFKTELYNWINCNGLLYRWKYLPDHFKQDLKKLYPVLSNTLKPHFDIAFDLPDFKNRYPRYFSTLEDFYDKYLNTEIFRSIIPISTAGFYKPTHSQIRNTNGASNELQYGNGIGREPKKDFKNKGPYRPVPPPNNVKFFFIYYKPERGTAVKAIYEYFLKGFQGQFSFPRMQDYIKQPFEIDTEGSIAFDNLDDAITVVQKAIRNKDKLPDTKYFAIYVNPVPKADKDINRNGIYYRIKEILLYEGISSQVIKSEHIYKNGSYNSDFNTFLPHLEIAILAKLGGVPWRLNRPTTNELIVGVGAFYSVTRKTKFVGSAFCFNNEGIFKGFDCFNANDTNSLAGSIREAVGKFIVTNHTASRLIIHFYKDIGKKELQPILRTLHTLGLNIPVIIVTINKTESKELLAFDMANVNKMPFSGTILRVSRVEYLLFNNTRYDESSKPAQKEYHFPVKISLSCSKDGMLDNMEVVEQLIDQVYQFSRMYWKSANQQSLPVTIKYPEMVAEIYPHFQHDKLPDFGKENLWFL